MVSFIPQDEDQGGEEETQNFQAGIFAFKCNVWNLNFKYNVWNLKFQVKCENSSVKCEIPNAAFEMPL